MPETLTPPRTVAVTSGPKEVLLTVTNQVSSNSFDAALTPDAAEKLAEILHRAAGKVRDRAEASNA